MVDWLPGDLIYRHSPQASVKPTGNGWILELQASSTKRGYDLAQVDDYVVLPRGKFLHMPPWSLSLQARVSAAELPGTWGFGLWNDPFGLSIGFGGRVRRLPALPQAAWFFHASTPNYLSLHDGVPGEGFFAGTICSLRLPSLLLAPTLLGLPFMPIRSFSRLARRLAGGMVHQDAASVSAPVTEWHTYTIQWLRESTVYLVDDQLVLRSLISPPPPLGLVVWIDNQYAYWDPSGRLGSGILEHPVAWLEVKNLHIG